MKEHLQRLLNSFREILESDDLMSRGEPEYLRIDNFELNEVSDLFRETFQLECPISMQPGLLIPGMVEVTWRHNDYVSGEIKLSDLITSINRTLDTSLMDWTLDGHKLANMRIADALTDMGGPLHILFEIEDGKIFEQLFLFDSRKLLRIELSYADYLDMAAATRGIVYWQYLFCDERLILMMADVLSAELDFLQFRFPALEISILRARLLERSK